MSPPQAYKKPTILFRENVRAGNWLPVPIGRLMGRMGKKKDPFTEMEAWLSLALSIRKNLFEGAPRVIPSQKSCRKRWGWGHERVAKFFEKEARWLLGFYLRPILEEEKARHLPVALESAPQTAPQTAPPQSSNVVPLRFLPAPQAAPESAPQAAPEDGSRLSEDYISESVSEKTTTGRPGARAAALVFEYWQAMGNNYRKDQESEVLNLLGLLAEEHPPELLGNAVHAVFRQKDPPRTPWRFNRDLRGALVEQEADRDAEHSTQGG